MKKRSEKQEDLENLKSDLAKVSTVLQKGLKTREHAAFVSRLKAAKRPRRSPPKNRLGSAWKIQRTTDSLPTTVAIPAGRMKRNNHTANSTAPIRR